MLPPIQKLLNISRWWILFSRNPRCMWEIRAMAVGYEAIGGDVSGANSFALEVKDQGWLCLIWPVSWEAQHVYYLRLYDTTKSMLLLKLLNVVFKKSCTLFRSAIQRFLLHHNSPTSCPKGLVTTRAGDMQCCTECLPRKRMATGTGDLAWTCRFLLGWAPGKPCEHFHHLPVATSVRWFF